LVLSRWEQVLVLQLVEEHLKKVEALSETIKDSKSRELHEFEREKYLPILEKFTKRRN